jgi:hypothetical protein
MPVGDVLVRDARSDVEHDDTALAVDVVTITKATELLLPSSIPDVELDLAKVLSKKISPRLTIEPSLLRNVRSGNQEGGPRHRAWLNNKIDFDHGGRAQTWTR